MSDYVEGLWLDPETGECNRDDEKFLASLYSFKKIFKKRLAEIESLVKAAARSRRESSLLSLARASAIVRGFAAGSGPKPKAKEQEGRAMFRRRYRHDDA